MKPVGKSAAADEHISAGEELAPVSRGRPSAELADFHLRHRVEIGELLRGLEKDEARGRGFSIRAGLMDPLHSVISERVKEFCRLPYRTTGGTIASCPGILEGWKGCPPHPPAVAETVDILSRAPAFLIVQFQGEEDQTRQGDAHVLIEKAARKLRERGYAVREAYACGPCRVCRRGCGEEPDCRQPERRLFALESCGFWVNSLCRRAAEFPLAGGGPEEVRWIRDWGLPEQDISLIRYVTGIVLG